jgi:hypothetical protein
MEQRFGFDFSNVRIHSDVRAARSASAVNAKAYTLENHVIFGDGHYTPESNDGKKLIAHELTHVLQQDYSGISTMAKRGILQRKSDNPTLCGGTWACAASPCKNPDPTREGGGGTATSWTLKIMIDIEAPSATDVTASTVGHTYVEFVDSTGRAYTFGFYPDKSSGTPDPLIKPLVRGCVVHPDTNHKSCVDYTETFVLTVDEFNAALSYAQDMCESPPPYHLQTWNCTTFAVEVTKKAGKSLPPVRGRLGYGMLSVVADNPYKLYEGLKRRDIGPTYRLTDAKEIRNTINEADTATIASIPIEEKIRIINILLDWWVHDSDIEVIKKIYQNATQQQRIPLRNFNNSRVLDLTDIGQRSKLRIILLE